MMIRVTLECAVQVPCGQRVSGLRLVPQCDQDHFQGEIVQYVSSMYVWWMPFSLSAASDVLRFLLRHCPGLAAAPDDNGKTLYDYLSAEDGWHIGLCPSPAVAGGRFVTVSWSAAGDELCRSQEGAAAVPLLLCVGTEYFLPHPQRPEMMRTIVGFLWIEWASASVGRYYSGIVTCIFIVQMPQPRDPIYIVYISGSSGWGRVKISDNLLQTNKRWWSK